MLLHCIMIYLEDLRFNAIGKQFFFQASGKGAFARLTDATDANYYSSRGVQDLQIDEVNLVMNEK